MTGRHLRTRSIASQSTDEECWSPTESRTARTVPFGWSDRITAALATVYDRWDVLAMSPEEARTMLDAAARKADDLNADTVTPTVLSASAAPFLFAFVLDVQSAATLLGVPERAVAAHADGQSDPVARLERLAGGVDDADSAAEFPLAVGTEAYPAEPFDLDDVDPETLARRAAETPPQPSRVPRGIERPESVDYDASEHEAAGPPTRPNPIHDAASHDAAMASAGADTPAEEHRSDPIAEEATEQSPSASEELVDVDAPAMGDGATVPGGADGEHDHGPGADSTPRDAVSHPVVADVSTRRRRPSGCHYPTAAVPAQGPCRGTLSAPSQRHADVGGRPGPRCRPRHRR